MCDQESCTCEVSQQAQGGQGHEMVQSVEQQIARALANGSPAHWTAAPAQDGERSANRGARGDLGNGHPDVRGNRVARPQRRALEV